MKMDLFPAELLRILAIIVLPVLGVMGLLLWWIKRQHDPSILDRKRERERRMQKKGSAPRRKR